MPRFYRGEINLGSPYKLRGLLWDKLEKNLDARVTYAMKSCALFHLGSGREKDEKEKTMGREISRRELFFPVTQFAFYFFNVLIAIPN